MKKRLLHLYLLLLAIIIAFPEVPALAYEGSCGSDITWKLEYGRLTISGSGLEFVSIPAALKLKPFGCFRGCTAVTEVHLTGSGDMCDYLAGGERNDRERCDGSRM